MPHLLSLFVFSLSAYLLGKYLGYKEGFKSGIDASLEPVKQKLDELESLHKNAREAQSHAWDMKMAFLERIHKILEVKVLIKDEKGITIETLEIQ